jgi:hypothetical protein
VARLLDRDAAATAPQIGYSFGPGEGVPTEDDIAALIAGATTRIKVASMVISSGKILQALADQLDAGRDVAGIYR